MRLLHAMLESLAYPVEASLAESVKRSYGEALEPAVPCLAELLVVDTTLHSRAQGKQAMNQPPRAEVDRAALQLEAAYLLPFVLNNLCEEVGLSFPRQHNC